MVGEMLTLTRPSPVKGAGALRLSPVKGAGALRLSLVEGEEARQTRQLWLTLVRARSMRTASDSWQSGSGSA